MQPSGSASRTPSSVTASGASIQKPCKSSCSAHLWLWRKPLSRASTFPRRCQAPSGVPRAGRAAGVSPWPHLGRAEGRGAVGLGLAVGDGQASRWGERSSSWAPGNPQGVGPVVRSSAAAAAAVEDAQQKGHSAALSAVEDAQQKGHSAALSAGPLGEGRPRVDRRSLLGATRNDKELGRGLHLHFDIAIHVRTYSEVRAPGGPRVGWCGNTKCSASRGALLGARVPHTHTCSTL